MRQCLQSKITSRLNFLKTLHTVSWGRDTHLNPKGVEHVTNEHCYKRRKPSPFPTMTTWACWGGCHCKDGDQASNAVLTCDDHIAQIIKRAHTDERFVIACDGSWNSLSVTCFNFPQRETLFLRRNVSSSLPVLFLERKHVLNVRTPAGMALMWLLQRVCVCVCVGG